MGIDLAWKNTILPNQFPSAFQEEIPAVEYIVDDFSLILRSKLFYGINGWKDVRARIYKRLLTGIKRPDLLKKYVILFDESEFVPPAKRPTQRKRRENQKHNGNPIFPFSDTEKRKFLVADDAVPEIATSFEKYLKRMWLSGGGII